jgi:SAM-dependent methyltransferase
MVIFDRVNTAIRGLCSLNRNREFSLLRRCVLQDSHGALLDIGSGDGYWTDRFAHDFHPSFGLEPDPQALRLAQKIHANRAQYVQGFAEALKFDDEQFDCVVSISCFEHFRSAQEALHEAHRVLKPGGRIAISVDSLLPENSCTDFRNWHRRKYFVTEYFSEQRLAGMLRDAGFEVDSQRTAHLITSPLSARVRELYLRHPQPLLPLFPLLYLLVLLSDRWDSQFPGQVVVMTARKTVHHHLSSKPAREDIASHASAFST